VNPRISVVVPAYNNADYLDTTLRSILDQTYQDFELIVADHSSSDDSLAIARRYEDDPRVTVVETEAGGGARRNWNRVSDLATGETIKLVCGDDVIYPTMLAEQLHAYDEGGQDVVLVASQRDLVDARGAVFVKARGLGSLDGKVDGKVALRASVRSGGNIFGEPACVLLRRETLTAVGGWQDLRYYIDAGSYAPILARGAMVALRSPLAAFRVSSTQWSVHLMRQQAQEAAQFHRIARELAPELISARDVSLGDFRARILAIQRRLAYVALGKRMRPE
jgi:glycosyltransferase involved in cell wall biosynthesis